jgi:hypothetical protein
MWTQTVFHGRRRVADATAMLGALAALLLQPAHAADLTVAPHRSVHRVYVIERQREIVLPPERHVVEVVAPPYSGNFIINGTHFAGVAPACLRWSAGERIQLLAGDWHGRCTEAVFYNLTLRSTCRMACG